MSDPAQPEIISPLDQKLHAIMDDLAKSAETPDGALRAGFISRDIETLCKLWDGEDTRPQAEAVLGAWRDGGGGELRKRIADHWIERAKGIVETGVTGGGADPKAIRQKKVHPVLARFRALQVTNKRATV